METHTFYLIIFIAVICKLYKLQVLSAFLICGLVPFLSPHKKAIDWQNACARTERSQ